MASTGKLNPKLHGADVEMAVPEGGSKGAEDKIYPLTRHLPEARDAPDADGAARPTAKERPDDRKSPGEPHHMPGRFYDSGLLEGKSYQATFDLARRADQTWAIAVCARNQLDFRFCNPLESEMHYWTSACHQLVAKKSSQIQPSMRPRPTAGSGRRYGVDPLEPPNSA
jgi:hypothetical protein